MKSILKWIGIGLVILAITLLVLLAFESVFPEGTAVNSEVLVVLAAAVLSMVFTYMPGLRTQFAALTSEQKQAIQLILIVVLAGFMFLVTCVGLFSVPGVICSKDGVMSLLVYVFLAAGGNQLTYKLSPQPQDVKNAKATRVNLES